MTPSVTQGTRLAETDLQLHIAASEKLALTRAESEKLIEPIILKCQGFSESAEAEGTCVAGVRPDVRRVSLIYSMAHSLLGDSAFGSALEIGSGYGYLLFSLAVLLRGMHWSAVEHPGRDYLRREAYIRAFREHRCSLRTVDILREPLPFPDGHFQLVTFSEVLEHLPVERVNCVLAEIARVVCVGGIVIASSPNQVSLENRIRLLKGGSILDMPDEVGYAKGTFGHVRLYTAAEISSAMSKRGLSLERCVLESNNSAYRGSSNGFWRRAYALYERLEKTLPLLQPMGDTWYMGFRKLAQ